MAQNYYLGMLILALALFGVVINVVSILILMRRRHATQMFHHLLKLLALYDLVSTKLKSISSWSSSFQNAPKVVF